LKSAPVPDAYLRRVWPPENVGACAREGEASKEKAIKKDVSRNDEMIGKKGELMASHRG